MERCQDTEDKVERTAYASALHTTIQTSEFELGISGDGKHRIHLEMNRLGSMGLTS